MSIFYLSSLESKAFKKVRKCILKKKISFDTGKDVYIAKIDPPLENGELFRNQEIDQILLSHRHEGHLISTSSVFPIFVFICRFRGEISKIASKINSSQVQILAWGELYRSYEDATDHVFDK